MKLEVQGYLNEFNTIRGDINKAIEGLSDGGANWCPLSKDTNSIYSILTHIMGANKFWIKQVINGETIQRDRAAEFTASGKLSELLTQWEKAWKETESILGKLEDTQLQESKALPSPVVVCKYNDNSQYQDGRNYHQRSWCGVGVVFY